MSIPLIINGVTYNFPSPFDTNWAPAVDAWAIAVTNALIQKSGGSFPLTGELDFGNSFGLRTLYVKSEEANVSSTGFLRMANASVGIGFRNSANSGDLVLTVNASNLLTFNGVPIGTPAALLDNHIYVGNVSNQPADVAMSGDVTIINTGATTISAGAITDSKVNASAAIAVSKLAALTAHRAVATDASGFLTPSATTDTELGYVSGVTSSIQTQINTVSGATAPSGAIIMYGAASAPSGWLLCDGTSYATATYPNLFAVIGYTYGGVGANFNVPNMVNNVPIGAGSSAALGVAIGANSVTPSITDPTHNHTQNAHQHSTTVSRSGSSGVIMDTTSPYGTDTRTVLWEGAAQNVNATNAQAYERTSSVTATNNASATGITVNSVNIIQPSLGVSFIIKQ